MNIDVSRNQSITCMALLSASVEDGLMFSFADPARPWCIDSMGRNKWDKHLEPSMASLLEAGFMAPHFGSGLFIPTELGVQAIESSLVPRLWYSGTVGVLENACGEDVRGNILYHDTLLYNFAEWASGDIYTRDGARWQEHMVSGFTVNACQENDSDSLWDFIAENPTEEPPPLDISNCIPQVLKRRNDVRPDLVRPVKVDLPDISVRIAYTTRIRNVQALHNSLGHFFMLMESWL